MDKQQKQTVDLAKTFSNLKTVEHKFMDLVEEVGELSTAILYFEGIKKGKLFGKIKKDDIADALCDIMYELYLIAETYNFDLDEEYKKMLLRLKARVENGEFKK